MIKNSVDGKVIGYHSGKLIRDQVVNFFIDIHSMEVKLKKEPDNKYDKEAILVKMKGVGQIGHVANSIHTVLGESMSAGRIYDKIGDTAKAKVILVTDHGTICKISKKSLIGTKYKKVEEEADE